MDNDRGCTHRVVEKLIFFYTKLVERKMPEQWRQSFMVPIFKGKKDIQECGNYGVIL